MADKNNGWEKPEEKFPETELEDSFAAFFSEEDEIGTSEKGKKRHKKGPDILAVSEESDEGFVIEEVVALDAGEGIIEIKEEHPEEEELEHEESECSEDSEKADANEEKDESEDDSEEEIIVDLSSEEGEEQTSQKKPGIFDRVKKHITAKRKHKYAATVGAVLIGLALIGTISLCSALINLGARVFDNTRQKEEFEWKIYPLLMFDPATFENPNQLDEVFVLKTALWSTLLENRTKYDYDETGMLLVPASDLDVAAKSLYGNAVVLKHQTFSEGYDYFYLFDDETNTYSVPVMGQTAGYAPKVVEIKKDGNIYTLIVGYVAPTTLWNVSADGSDESVPDKYLYYDLEKIENGNYIIKSVRRIPEDELPDDLEVSDMQSLNQTQYFDYDAIQQEQMNQQLEEEIPSSEETAETEDTNEGESSEESSSESESSEENSSDDE